MRVLLGRLAGIASLCVAMFGLAVLSPARAAGPGGTPSGTIVLMGYSGPVKDNYTAAVIRPFMEKYPNVKVIYDAAGSSAQMLGMLRAQKAHPQVDVDIMDFSVSRVANKEGLFSPLDPAIVTNLSDLYEPARTPGNMGPGIDFDNLVLIYNTQAMKTPPVGIKDLVDPANRGKITFPPAPNVIGIALELVVAKYLGVDYKGSQDPEIAVLKKIARNVSTWSPMPDAYTMVINGDADLGVGWNARAQTYIGKSGGKLGAVTMKAGSILDIDTINLVAHSRNPEAAQLFINFALSPGAQERYAKLMFYGPTNQDAKLPPDILARTSSYPPTLKKMIPVDWNYVASVQDKWTERWRREVVPTH
ncbi:MAG: ABC transporter substrate-binding protein [Acetobacteraceae bacterium]